MRISLLFITILAFCFVNNAMANQDSIFIIKNIKVDEISDTAEKARKKAINYAQKYAFEQVIEKLLTLNNTEFTIEADRIANLVQTMEVKNEVITKQQYKAKIDIYFQIEQTKFFINNNLLNKSNKKNSFLLIPVLNENGLIKLWQKGNLWHNIWLKSQLSEVVGIKIPLGDLDDMMHFNISNLDNVSDNKITELKKYYQVDHILITELKYNYTDLDQEVVFESKLKILGDNENSNTITTSDGFKDDDYNKHFNYLISQIIKNLENGWIEYNNQSNKNWQEFIIKTKNIYDWLAIKENLSSLELVKSFKVDAYSLRYAKITVKFKKSFYDVINGLRAHGFKISRDDDKIILQTNN
jgi:hypothetical protein